MFISLRTMVINTNNIEIIKPVSRDTGLGAVVYMVSGWELDLSKEDVHELLAFMDKNAMIHRSHE